MRVLITNDDGISAPGMAVLEKIATEVAGPDGEVWTVAPATEKSGVGHCINYAFPTLLNQLGTRKFTVEGNPADAVLAAVHHVMKDSPPDLILSGVNRGNNSGENVVYSGTLGAAMEGALQGYTSIALSQFYGPDNNDLDDPFEASAAWSVRVIEKILSHPSGPFPGYRYFYNVNFPPCPAASVKGVKVCSQGFRSETRHGVTPQQRGKRTFLWISGGPQSVETGPDTDVTANVQGYVSVTPLTADLTARDALSSLREVFEA